MKHIENVLGWAFAIGYLTYIALLLVMPLLVVWLFLVSIGVA